MSQCVSLKEILAIYEQKFSYGDNPGQNIWSKVKTSRKIG